MKKIEEFVANAPDSVIRFIGGFIAGLFIVVASIMAIAPLVLAIWVSWKWLWAYAIVIPVLFGAFATID